MERRRLFGTVLLLALLLPIMAACGGGTTSPTAGPATEATASSNGSTAATTVTEATAAPAETMAPAETAAPAMTEMATTGAAMGETATTGAAMAGETATTSAATGETATTGAAMGEAATAGGTGDGAASTVDWSKIEVEDGAKLRFGAAGNPTEQQLYIQGAERFNKQFPKAKLTFEPIADYQTAMKAAMAGGTAPDVFLLDGELMGAFGPENLLLPLDDAMKSAGVQASAYYDELIKLYQQDGKQLGIPKDFNPVVLFINNQMAKDAGVDPKNIKTWDDMKDAAKKMTKGEGPGKTYGVCLNSDILRSGAFMFQNGNPIIKENKAVFNDPKGIEALDFWNSFKKDGTGELYGEMGKGWCGEAFSGKNAAMVLEGGWLVPFMADPANGAQDVKYTAVPLPTPKSGKQATWLFTNGFAANAKTKYPKAAAAAVLFLTGMANQKALIPSGLASPSIKALASDPYFQQNEVARVLVEQGKNGQLADTVLGGPKKKGDVLKPLNDATASIFTGTATKDALDQAAQQVDEVLSK